MNNYEKTREVLEGLNSLFESGAICTSYMNTAEETWQIEELYRKAQAALALSPRQCDVGTAEEQAKRWEQFCIEHHEPWKPGVPAIAPQICKCPCYRTGQCNMFVWSQMPYEAQEGGKK